jgi:hypothetical protein
LLKAAARLRPCFTCVKPCKTLREKPEVVRGLPAMVPSGPLTPPCARRTVDSDTETRTAPEQTAAALLEVLPRLMRFLHQGLRGYPLTMQQLRVLGTLADGEPLGRRGGG